MKIFLINVTKHSVIDMKLIFQFFYSMNASLMLCWSVHYIPTCIINIEIRENKYYLFVYSRTSHIPASVVVINNITNVFFLLYIVHLPWMCFLYLLKTAKNEKVQNIKVFRNKRLYGILNVLVGFMYTNSFMR